MLQLINEMKAQIEKHRVDRAIQSLLRKEKSFGFEYDHKEEELISAIQTEKVNIYLGVDSQV